MATNYFQEIADDRIDKAIDFSKINSKEDYIDAVKDFLKTPVGGDHPSRGLNIIHHAEEIYENSTKAKEMIQKNKLKKVKEEEDAFREAQRFERRRALKERLRDESRTAKNTKPATKISVKGWRMHPTRMDIRGVDTRIKRRGTISIITRTKEMELRGKGVAVVYDVRGFRRLRDIRTGRFTKVRGL